MSKKNLPNIPIYIGDWERDCNVLSLESEAAWMRIVFKLWTNGKQNAIKMPAKSLQNLWRCGPDKVKEVLYELKHNNICTINESNGFVEFTCRRFVKENEISEIRSKAAKGEKEANRFKQNKSKLAAKGIQNAENEIEIIYEEEKVNDLFQQLKTSIANHEQDSWIENTARALGVKNEKINDLLVKFRTHVKAKKQVHKNLNELTDHFYSWGLKLDSLGHLNEYKIVRPGRL